MPWAMASQRSSTVPGGGLFEESLSLEKAISMGLKSGL